MPGDTIKPETGIVVGEETLDVRDCALNEHETADRNLFTLPDTTASLHVGLTLVDEDVGNIQQVAGIVQKPQMADGRLVHIANAIALLPKLAKLALESTNLDATKIQIAPMFRTGKCGTGLGRLRTGASQGFWAGNGLLLIIKCCPMESIYIP